MDNGTQTGLKSCPFCGGKADYYGDCDMIKVKCQTYDCACQTIAWFDEPEDAAEE